MTGTHEENQAPPPYSPPPYSQPNPTSHEPLYPSVSFNKEKEPAAVNDPSTASKANGSQPIPAEAETVLKAPPSEEDAKKWGTHIMGPPAIPTKHPDNQKAATWKAGELQQQLFEQQPYLVHSPVDKPASNPYESIMQFFNSWGKKNEIMARNIWQNLKTGSSVSGAAWGKVNLTAKAMTEGGFENLFKQIFATEPNERLKKTFACYLSTATGPVAGTLYLSDIRFAFCSDRPLSFSDPSGQEAWSYYKVMIPLANIGTINPVIMRESQSERYIQIVTVDGHDFWYMGFVNYDKASRHLSDTVSEFRQSGHAALPLSG